MKSFKLVYKQVGTLVAVFAVVISAFAPALASAAVVTSRSVTLSSSAKDATLVSYKFSFTTSAIASTAVVYFCSNSPLIGEACTNPNTTPGGFTAAGAGASNATVSGTPTTNQVVVTKSFTAGANDFTLTSITNPNTAGSLYARVVTYASAGDATGYIASPTAPGTHVDEGSFAISITDGLNVSGQVLESLVFCTSTSATALSADCGNATMGAITLGTDDGSGVKALRTDAPSTADVQTQLSTNALGGAVVRLKSDASGCGGLLRAGTGTASERCGIAPATTDIAAGDSKFGVKVGASEDADGATGSGTYQVVPASGYDSSAYHLNYPGDDDTGVTSVYGDDLLNTNAGPVNNKNITLTFGAQINNSTPAGSYSAKLSLIATGTF